MEYFAGNECKCMLLRLKHTISYLLCGVALSFGQTVDADSAVEAQVQDVDLDTRLYSDTVEHSFSIKNTGNSDLTVYVTKTSCGCTVALPPVTAIPPGGEGTITLEYRPKYDRKRMGPQEFTALIGTNDPNRPEFTLTMKLKLVESVSVEPTSIDFAVKDGDNSIYQREFRLRCLKGDTLPKILSVKSSPVDLVCTSMRQEVQDFWVDHIYQVTVDLSSADNNRDATIVVETDSTQVPVIEIPVKILRDWPLKFSPTNLLFGVVKGNTVTRKSTFAASSSAEAEPGAVVSSDARISCELKATPEGKREIVATLTAGAAGAQPERIDATIDVLGKDQLKVGEVPVRAIVAAGAK